MLTLNDFDRRINNFYSCEAWGFTELKIFSLELINWLLLSYVSMPAKDKPLLKPLIKHMREVNSILDQIGMNKETITADFLDNFRAKMLSLIKDARSFGYF